MISPKSYVLNLMMMLALSLNISHASIDDEAYTEMACIKPNTEQNFDHVGCLN